MKYLASDVKQSINQSICKDSRLVVLVPRSEGLRANTTDRESIQGQFRNSHFIILLLNNPIKKNKTCKKASIYIYNTNILE